MSVVPRMDIVLQKSEEDRLLFTCDGTCVRGSSCLCVVDQVTALSGQAMFDYGFSTCVLCQRAEGQNYCTIPDNYPMSWIYDGYKIKYDRGNYRKTGLNSIEQIVDDPDVCKESWISNLYYTSTELVDEGSVRWKLVVCETPNCKHNVHVYIDVHRAIGVSNSYYDVEQECVKCEFCHEALRYIDSSNGIVEFENRAYTRCRFCFTVIFLQSKVPIQACTTCYKQCQSDVQKGRHICFYCKNTINVSQKKNIQEFKIRKTPTSHTETVYLCRLHRVYPQDPSKIFKISELLSMF